VSSRSPAQLSDPIELVIGERVRDERATHGPQLLDPLTTIEALRLHLTAEVLALQPGRYGRSACPAAILAGCFRDSHEHPVANDQGVSLAVTHSDITLQRGLGAGSLRYYPGSRPAKRLIRCFLSVDETTSGGHGLQRRPTAATNPGCATLRLGPCLAGTAGCRILPIATYVTVKNYSHTSG
jgi:hypothetical protein